MLNKSLRTGRSKSWDLGIDPDPEVAPGVISTRCEDCCFAREFGCCGAQLFGLGIFGEYLARMHFRTVDRPAYVIGEETAPPDPADPKSLSDYQIFKKRSFGK